MTFTPYPSQAHDLEVFRAGGHTGLNITETSGGKTAQACLSIRDADPDVVLIVAPRATIIDPTRNWGEAVREITGRELRFCGNQKKEYRDNLTDFEWGIRGVYAMTHQFFTRVAEERFRSWSGDMLIIDEVHKLATPKSKGQVRMSGYTAKDQPIRDRFPIRQALSGTPYRQRFENMWSIMRFLWPEYQERGEIAYDNYYMWCKERLESQEVYTSRRDVYGNPKTVTVYGMEKEPGRLVSEMPTVVIHKRRERCCEFHPNGFMEEVEPKVLDHVVELTSKQAKAIRELENHYMTWLDENPLVTDLSLTQKQRIRQICLGEPDVEYWYDDEGNERTTLVWDKDCKSPALEELLDILESVEPEPVVVFLSSQKFAEVAVHRLRNAGITAEEYSGVRKADLSKFGQDYRVLVAVTESIGEGTDGLQHVAHTEVWLEIPVSATMYEQATARLDRVGGQQVLRFRILDEEGYAEGRINALLQHKLNARQSLRKKEVS